MKDDYRLRFACLQEGIGYSQHAGGDPIEHARKFSDFVFGKNDAEVIRAAGELAKTVQPKP